MSRTSGKAVVRWSAQSLIVGALAGQRGQLAVQEVAERLAGDVDVFAVAVDEVHRHVEHVVEVALEAEAVLEHERQHAGAVGVGVGPDVAAEGLEAVGLALGERRVGEQRGGDRLQRQADAELLHHVGFGLEVEVDLDGAGAQHHVEAEPADLRHVAAHDRVAALGHQRQLVARPLRLDSRGRGSRARARRRSPSLVEVPPISQQVWWRFSSGAPRQLELAGGLEADRAVAASVSAIDVAVLDTGSQPNAVRPSSRARMPCGPS